MLKDKFQTTYQRAPDDIVFCPYRICPLGAHIDHNHGKVLGFAIDKGIHFAYGKKENGICELVSLQFGKRAQWHIGSVPKEKQGDWADYLRGVTLVLSKKYNLTKGVCGIISGDLPIGGLSSSAAVTLAFLVALCRANGIRLNKDELISFAKKAENEYVGVACGVLDQSCEVLCKKDNLLCLDTKDNSYELIPIKTDTEFEIAIFFSGIERTLVGSKFNMRVDELKSAAYALLAYSGSEYGKFKDTVMRDVSPEIYFEYKSKLPDSWRKRAEHYFTEFARVETGTELWKEGDIKSFGKLITQSGFSSVNNYETGSPELTALFKILSDTDGVFGARFSGAGFKGCCMALIEPTKKNEIFDKVKSEYLAEFPNLSDKYLAVTVKTADGIKI